MSSSAGLPASEADLVEANRRGEFAPSQKRWVVMRLLPSLFTGAVGGLFLIPFGLCFALSLGPSLLTDGDWLPALFLGGVGLLLAVGAVGALWSVAPAALALVDVYSGRMEAAAGRLVWKGREYRGEIEGRQLRLLTGDERAPGGYRFYYLPRSGFIVSAERAFLSGLETNSDAELRRALQDVFDFQPEDLQENATGRLSARQAAGQWWAYGRQGLLLGLFFVPFILVFGFMFPYLFLFQDGLAGEPLPMANLIPALCAPAFILLFGVLALSGLVKPLQDLRAGVVETASGEVTERRIVTGSGKSRRTNYYYELAGQRYSVPAVALQALVQGRPYRLYFLPRSKKVISVEPL